MRVIDADALRVFLDRQYNNCHGYHGIKKEVYREALRAVKSYVHREGQIDAKSVQHGHWIFHTFEEVMNGDWIVLSDWQGNGFECSTCSRLVDETKMAYRYKYCPNCGAKMDEASE